MNNDRWKAAAIFLAGLLITTNAGHFYARRVAAADTVPLACPALDASMLECQDIDRPSDAPDVHYLPGAFEDATRAQPGDRCENGQLIGKRNGSWQKVGSC